MAAAAPLRVLLYPARPSLGDVVQARLSPGRVALGTVAVGGELRLTGLASAEGSRDDPSARLPGQWREFTWESVEENGSAADSLRLLALSKTYELCIYEVSQEVGKCVSRLLHSCSEERLQKLLQSRGIGLSSISSLRLLSFKNNRALVLLNHCIIAHLAFPEGEVKANENDVFLLDLPPLALERIVDVAFCKGVIFLLDESGWMYIFAAEDGVCLAHVDMSLYEAEGQEEKKADDPPPLTSLSVSRDLGTVVITNCSSCAMAIDLNLYFKEHPDHLLCKRNVERPPVEWLEGIDEDDLRNSSCSWVKPAFRTDRSWKAHLSSLDDATKTLNSPALVTAVYLPWYQSFLNLEQNLDCEQQEASENTLLDDAVCLLSNARGKDGENASKGERCWKNIHLGEKEECVKLDCKSVTGFSALFTVSSESEGLVLALWDLETQDVTYSCVGKSSFFVECSREEQLCLIFSEPGLSLVLFSLTQEEFLNRLIIHGTAGTVDTVCQLNGWGRCSIPIHALEAGLENRQLDTVGFFLKNKENLFSLSSTCLRDQPASVMSDLFLKSVEELRPALDLLCLAIRENDLEAHSKHFSEQLLNLTMSFLNKELCDIFTHVDELDDNLDRCVDILTNYITKLRTFMIKFPHQQSSSLSPPCDLEDDVPQIKRSQVWDKLHTEETVADAISNNQLPEAQTFFRISRNPAQNLEELVQIGLDLVYRSLLREDITEASRLLKNMGFHVTEQLHKICFFVSDRDVRDFLVKILQEENCFSETEKEMIDFVHQVENVYSRAFQKNKQTMVHSRHWQEEKDLPSHSRALDMFLNLTEDQAHAGEHRIMLNWARWWDKVTQEMVLLPTRTPEEFKSCNPEVLWMHLTSWHDWMNINSWIEEFQPQTVCTHWPQLTVEAIDQSTLCSSYMRNEILDNLARTGTFVPSELEDFECLLQRLTFIGGVMQNPPSVPEHAPAGSLDFHARFILYCLERGLDHLLYTYLDYYR